MSDAPVHDRLGLGVSEVVSYRPNHNPVRYVT